jgi:hypothetical protein
MFDEVLESIIENKIRDNFLYPFYEKYCISNLPSLILSLFNVNTEKKTLKPQGFHNKIEIKNINKIVLFILDGFGVNQFQNYAKSIRFFNNFNKKGYIFPLTSIYPSQTTNAIATLNTGLTPQEHGLFEYFIYMKKPDMIINTLRFEPMNLNYQNVFKQKNYSFELLFNGKTIYDILNENDIKSFSHMYIRDAYSSCSKVFFKGSTSVPSLKSSDLIINLRKTIEKINGPAYHFVHLGNLDTIAHHYGPQSEEYFTELSQIASLIKNSFINKIDKKSSKETLLILTSDHGVIDVIPEKTTYLNKYPKLIKNLQFSKRGTPILPTGSPRDIFLHVKKEKLTETKQILSQNLEKKAEIIETTTAIKKGLFGVGEISNKFSERAGNLLILPHDNETIWFEHFKGLKFGSIGHHGGLNQNEMLVPFMASKLCDLKDV